MIYLKLFENFKQPIDAIKAKIRDIVVNIGHRKGRPFFNALDDAIKDDKFVLELVKGYENDWIASSGGFGDTLFRLYNEKRFKCKGLVIFNGKMLTDGLGVNYWYPETFDLNDKEFVYLDDSYFSGGTATKITNFLKLRNSNVYEIAVIYDGSEIKLDNVHSFYRYWDYRDLQKYKSVKVNESIIDKSDLIDFCETNLAHLIDKRFKLDIKDNKSSYYIDVMKYISRSDRDDRATSYFKWDDIVDSIIPFLEILNDEYTIEECYIFFQGATNSFSYEELINFEIDGSKSLKGIRMKIEMKKAE